MRLLLKTIWRCHWFKCENIYLKRIVYALCSAIIPYMTSLNYQIITHDQRPTIFDSKNWSTLYFKFLCHTFKVLILMIITTHQARVCLCLLSHISFLCQNYQNWKESDSNKIDNKIFNDTLCNKNMQFFCIFIFVISLYGSWKVNETWLPDIWKWMNYFL